MKDETTKKHWDNIYANKQPDEVSWTQEYPKASLDLIRGLELPKHARIIDVGGGDSRLADHLLDEGYKDITVLDISGMALKRAQKRLGEQAGYVHWIVADVTEFVAEKAFDLWHDRATFHFMTTPAKISAYLKRAKHAIKINGYMTLGTFSEKGPDICSGLEVKQYTEESLREQVENGFRKITCVTEDHRTPFNTLQNFLFCSFKRHTIRKGQAITP